MADLVYGNCPKCGSRIAEPFHRPREEPYRVFRFHKSRGGRSNCKVVLNVLPSGKIVGEAVPEGASFEEMVARG